VHDLVNVSAEQLSRDKDPVIIVISTWNRGKPPFFARRFYAELEEGKTRMPARTYTVIALGDEHYEYFCACGINVDRMLESLGGKRFMPRTVMGSTFRTDLTKWAQAFWRNLP
jgi:sulfite reductase (NADPH) flavoprotein alpha-component